MYYKNLPDKDYYGIPHEPIVEEDLPTAADAFLREIKNVYYPVLEKWVENINNIVKGVEIDLNGRLESKDE